MFEKTNSTTYRMEHFWRIVALIVLVSAIIITAISIEYREDMADYSAEYKAKIKKEALITESEVSKQFHMMYQGLRTIARLAATKKIDRHAENLETSAKQTIQEIYNNLFTNLSLSEIYIVPVSFEPELIDKTTGQLQQPIISFDEYIIGAKTRDPLANDTGSEEEIEIFEYRLMKHQLEWFQEHYPDESTINGLDYPVLGGEEIITCDNTYYNREKKNDRRYGLVYSVPFYGDDGKLKGVVSGVVLTRIISALLNNPNFVLMNNDYGYLIYPELTGAWSNSKEYILSGLANPNLFYSDVLPSQIKDGKGAWELWIGVSDDEYWSQPQIQAKMRFTALLIGLVLAFTTGIVFYLVVQRKHERIIETQNYFLEQKVKDRTRELQYTNEELNKANSTKSEFLSRVSHELRTPLNAIIGYSELLIDETEGHASPVVISDSRKIRSSAYHLLSLIDDVLDLSKIEAGKMEVYNEKFKISEMIHDVMISAEPLIKRNDNTFEIKGVDGIGEMEGDLLKTKQILMNLLSNSAKFTEKGVVTLEVDKFTSDRQTWIRFAVKDSGIGMSDEHLKQVFDEFFQAGANISRDYGGTGLGTAICKKFAELMNGQIMAESKRGVGSTFTVILPLLASSSAPVDS